MPPARVKVLDCTLRDGGYYNDWDFHPQTVQAYLKAVAASGIDVVEIGFRFPPREHFLGPFAYSTDNFLRRLEVPDGLTLAVMCNASDIIKDNSLVDKMFAPASESPVSMVRIAAHLEEVKALRSSILKLRQKGYQIGFNIMQVSKADRPTLEWIATEVREWNAVDILYFADSLGNMDTAQIVDVATALRSAWPGELGLHTHDNMSRALSNCRAAVEAGVTWLDATITGMGRGAGNVRTEYLLVDLARRGLGAFKPEEVFEVAIGPFEALRERHRWGNNLLYFLSAAYEIHPTYAQTMLSLPDYTPEKAISALKLLHEQGALSYSSERLHRAIVPSGSETGTWSAKGWAKGRPILIVGSGPWMRDHVISCLNFVQDEKPLVIVLNTDTSLPRDSVDAFVACHDLRFAMQKENYRELGAPLIAPGSAIPDAIRDALGSDGFKDYGMRVTPGRFEFSEHGCVVPYRLAAAYALAIATAADASRIYLAGFDGYPHHDHRNEEMNEVFHLYQAAEGARKLIAITPTIYHVPQSSIFAPKL